MLLKLSHAAHTAEVHKQVSLQVKDWPRHVGGLQSKQIHSICHLLSLLAVLVVCKQTWQSSTEPLNGLIAGMNLLDRKQSNAYLWVGQLT